MIGWVPDLLTFSANSRAPHKLKLSHIPIFLILFSLQCAAKSSIFIAPSQIEY